MVLWSDIDTNMIEESKFGTTRTKFRIGSEPLRFQIPRGICTWGVSAYKSMQIDLTNPSFIHWWKDLETQLCPQEPFNSNIKGSSLRLKVDDSVYIFDHNSKQICPDVKEGLFRGQDVTCMIDIDSNYFFNGNWGLTVKLYQIKLMTECVDTPPDATPDSLISLPKGICAFLETDAS